MMPRRKPCGCTFCPNCLTLPLVENDGDVARPLEDRADPAARAGPETSLGGTVIGDGALDHEVVDIEVEVVFGVGGGRKHDLRHGARVRRLDVAEQSERLVDGEAGKAFEDEPNLAGRGAEPLG